MSWTKILGVNVALIVAMLVLIELVSSTIYFHRNSASNANFSSLWLIDGIANEIDRNRALAEVDSLPRYDVVSILSSPKTDADKAFSNYLLDEYQTELGQLVANLEGKGIPLWILWLPTDTSLEHNEFFYEFFRDVAASHDLHFVHGKDLLELPRDHVFLRPYNGHLTRYANILIAEKLEQETLSKGVVPRGPMKCLDIQGMWSREKTEVWSIIPEVPYLHTTDRFGFRSSLPTSEPNGLPVLLLAGDSFTFGPYLSSYDTYPAHLQRKLESFHVVNGGVSSFSIRSERDLIERNVDCLNPSLVVLQVLDNDIGGMAIAQYNQFNFSGEILDVPEVELDFYESIGSPISRK